MANRPHSEPNGRARCRDSSRAGPREHWISDTEDADAIVRVRSGDSSAYAGLVRRHAPFATRVAVLWGAGADADDVVQEAFVKAYGALDRFRTDSAFRPWLVRIVTNETRNLHRARVRRASREQDWGWPLATETVTGPEEVILSAERSSELIHAIHTLPTDLREMINCRYLLELSEAETAIALGIPRGTVKSRLHRAMERLRKEVRHDSTIP